MYSKDSRAVTAHLMAMKHVKDVIVLDAGLCVLLVLSTGGFSYYIAQQCITVLTKAQATTIADNYWHKATFLEKCKEHGL